MCTCPWLSHCPCTSPTHRAARRKMATHAPPPRRAGPFTAACFLLVFCAAASSAAEHADEFGDFVFCAAEGSTCACDGLARWGYIEEASAAGAAALGSHKRWVGQLVPSACVESECRRGCPGRRGQKDTSALLVCRLKNGHA